MISTSTDTQFAVSTMTPKAVRKYKQQLSQCEDLLLSILNDALADGAAMCDCTMVERKCACCDEKVYLRRFAAAPGLDEVLLRFGYEAYVYASFSSPTERSPYAVALVPSSAATDEFRQQHVKDLAKQLRQQ